MKVAIVTLPPVRIATMRKTGPYGPEIGQFWMQTFRGTGPAGRTHLRHRP
jgi:DNA gyrase inhibitor GyrI